MWEAGQLEPEVVWDFPGVFLVGTSLQATHASLPRTWDAPGG